MLWVGGLPDRAIFLVRTDLQKRQLGEESRDAFLGEFQ